MPTPSPTATPQATPTPTPEATHTAFDCPAEHAVSSIDASGRPVCVFSGPDGLYPKWSGDWSANQFECPPEYQVSFLHADYRNSNNATWAACFYKQQPTPATEAKIASKAFECPSGSVLRGFDKSGHPVCRSTSAPFPLGFGRAPAWDGDWTQNKFSCPYGTDLQSHHYECPGGCSNNATYFVCQRNKKADEDTKQGTGKATDDPALVDSICRDDQVVTGFDGWGRVVCSEPAPRGVPAGFGITSERTGNWENNNFSCPSGLQLRLLHYDVFNSNNASWYGCY